MDIIRSKNIYNNNNSEVGIYELTATTVPHNILGKLTEIQKEYTYEHKTDLIHNNLSTVLIIRRNKVNHNFNLNNATLFKRETNLDGKPLSANIKSYQNINLHPRFFSSISFLKRNKPIQSQHA